MQRFEQDARSVAVNVNSQDQIHWTPYMRILFSISNARRFVVNVSHGLLLYGLSHQFFIVVLLHGMYLQIS